MPTDADHLYDTDLHAWALREAEKLRARSGNTLDWDLVAEEIESVGKSESRELDSRATVLLAHLLKWMFQPSHRGASWEITIKRERLQISRHLARNPSLDARKLTALAEAYDVARLDAAQETGLPEALFPLEPPFPLEAALDPDFWPEGDV
jgi:hypothetical protein